MNILFDETQKERGNIGDNFQKLAELLEKNGHKVRKYDTYPIKYSTISNTDIFVFLCPDGSKMYGHEIKALLRFVDEGGCVAIFANAGGDKGLNTNLNTLLKHFDIELVANQIFDYQNFDLKLESNVVISNIYTNPLTEGIENITFVSGCSIHIGKDVEELARTDNSSDPPSATVIAKTSYGLGTVFVCGSYLMFSDKKSGLDLRDNKKLALNIFNNIAETPLKKKKTATQPTKEEVKTDVETPVVDSLSKVEMVKEVLQRGESDSVKTEVMKAMEMLKQEVKAQKPEATEEAPKLKKEDIYEAISVIQDLEDEIDSLNIEDPGYRDILITDMARRKGIDYTQVLPYLEKLREREEKEESVEPSRKEVDISDMPVPTPADQFEKDLMWFDDKLKDLDTQDMIPSATIREPIDRVNINALVLAIRELKNSVDILSANLIHLMSEILIELKEQPKKRK